jgi:hypothetical protein
MNRVEHYGDVVGYFSSTEKEKFAFYAFLLYTSKDGEIANYVKNYRAELSQLSGKDCLIFYHDKSSKSETSSSGEAYITARAIGIELNEIPCIVFFKNINDESVLIYSLNNNLLKKDIKTELRNLFEAIRDCISRYDSRDDFDNRNDLYDCLANYIRENDIKNFLPNLKVKKLLSKIGKFLPLMSFCLQLKQSIFGSHV